MPKRSRIEASRIIPRMHQGSVPPEGETLARSGFDVLVLCAQEHQPPANAFPGIVVLRVALDDSGTPMTDREWHDAQQAAKAVAAAVEAGARVLVTCQMGRNRSGLVSALALHLLTGKSGMKCVKHVQSRRANALTNRWFVAALWRIPDNVSLARRAEERDRLMARAGNL